MKYFYIFFFLIGLLINVKAQDSTSSKKIREFHMALSGFSNISTQIKYKTQIGAKRFFKVGLINLYYYENAVSNSGAANIKSRQFSAGLEVGLEFRTNLYNQFAFYHGPNMNFSYQGNETKTSSPYSSNGFSRYTVGIPYTLGLLFNIKNHFYFTAEINPGIYYSIQNNSNNSNFNVGFNNQLGSFALAYRL